MNEHLNNLFVTQWSTRVGYDEYVEKCAPLSCTYQTTEATNFSEALTLLISLYGGLIMVFRLVVPYLVSIAFRISRSVRNGARLARGMPLHFSCT